MQDLSFLCLFHPLTEVYLDDDQNFLNTIKFAFRRKKIDTFTSPLVLSEVLAKEVEPIEKVLHFSSMAEADSFEQRRINFSILDLHKLIYDKRRFTFKAIAVVDYNMPEMNGLEFCEQIKDRNIYKILLTANQDKDIAIEAFNDGIIDKFIMKQVRELFPRLEIALAQLKERYFNDLTKPLLRGLGDEINALVNDAEFLTLCENTYRQAKAVEYYLMDKSGSYLFLDENAEPTWLIIRNEKDFEEHLQMLQGLDANASLLNEIKNRRKLLFLLSENEYKKPVEQWSQHLFKCQRLKNSNTYFAIVKGKISDAIAWDRIEPFRDALIK